MNRLFPYLSRIAAALAGASLFIMPLAARADVSLSIQSLSPSTSVSSGTAVSFTVSPSGFSNPSFSLSDSFSGSTASSGNINSGGNFSWTPTTADIGTHTFTITVSDSAGDTASTQEQINVMAPASLSIQSLSPGSSVNAGQTLTFSAVASGFSGPVYSVTDSFGNSTLSAGDINSSGYFSWTPSASDAGTHTITVSVSDSSGHSASAQTTVTVSVMPGAVIQSLSPGASVAVGSPVSFVAAATGFSSPAYTLSDSFSGSTVSNADINSSGDFSWTPSSSDLGPHTITVYISDSLGHSATLTQQITVANPSVAVTTVSPGTAVGAGTTLSVYAPSQGFSNPTYSVADSFAGSSIANGDFSGSTLTWTPAASDAGAHTLTISVSDSSGHSASTEITIDVTGTQTATPAAPSTATLPASGLNASQIQSILSLLASFGADQSVINNVSLSLTGGAAASTAPSVAAPPASTGYTFTSYLEQGDEGDEVMALQQLLAAQGYLSATPNGYFGPATEAAVEAFQAAKGIDQLGVVGPSTRAALNSVESASPSSVSSASDYTFTDFLNVGSEGPEVTALQQKLSSLGYFSGDATGYFGDETEAAVEAFQTAHGIDAVGYVGPATRDALNQ